MFFWSDTNIFVVERLILKCYLYSQFGPLSPHKVFLKLYSSFPFLTMALHCQEIYNHTNQVECERVFHVCVLVRNTTCNATICSICSNDTISLIWPRSQVTNDEENKWGLPTCDPKWKTTTKQQQNNITHMSILINKNKHKYTNLKRTLYVNILCASILTNSFQ